MQIIRTFTTDSLGKTRPAQLTHRTTVAQHFTAFYALDTCDVWTDDGYLVTAVQDDGVTHHLRKGNQVVVAKLPEDQVLAFNPTPKARHYLNLAN
jgi:hypothetical protein